MKNGHEIEIRRDNGKKVKIFVKVRTEFYSNAGVYYDVEVTYCEPRKRTWQSVWSPDDYTWRRLNNEGKSVYVHKKKLEHVTEEEIQQAKVELWYLIRP